MKLVGKNMKQRTRFRKTKETSFIQRHGGNGPTGVWVAESLLGQSFLCTKWRESHHTAAAEPTALVRLPVSFPLCPLVRSVLGSVVSRCLVPVSQHGERWHISAVFV